MSTSEESRQGQDGVPGRETPSPSSRTAAVPGTVQQGGVLELREERTVVSTERVMAGQVQVRRVVETRTEMVPVQLTRETLILEVQAGGPAVRIGERLLQAGEVMDLVLYDEETVVSVRPFVTQEVVVSKRRVTETQQVQVELGREVLQVDQTGELLVMDPGAAPPPERQP